jgi:hypothetical protein
VLARGKLVVHVRAWFRFLVNGSREQDATTP